MLILVLSCPRKCIGSFLFLFKVFNIRNEGVTAVLRKIMCLCQVTGSESGEDGNGAILCAYSLPLFCSQPEVSSQKLTEKMPFFL